MGTTQTTLFPPPTRTSVVDDKGYLAIPLRQWLFTLQYLLPLRLVDTSGGPYSEALPPAGLNSTTGQSNQNQEIVYVKVSSDANVFTLTGGQGGSATLSAQYGVLRFKSDGTSWWQVGSAAAAPAGGGIPTPTSEMFSLWTVSFNLISGSSATSWVAINDASIDTGGSGSFAGVSPTATANLSLVCTGNEYVIGSSKFYAGRAFTFEYAGGVSTNAATASSYQSFGLSDGSGNWFVGGGAPAGNFVLFVGNGPTWLCQASDGSVIASVDSLIPVGARHVFSITYTPSSAIFKIDGVTVGTITTHLPVSTTPLAILVANNLAGPGAHTLSGEYIYCSQPSA